MGKWIVFDTQELNVGDFESYEEALREYERLKDEIIAGEVEEPSTEVYMAELKRVSQMVEDKDNEDDPKRHGFDYWVKWEEFSQ